MKIYITLITLLFLACSTSNVKTTANESSEDKDVNQINELDVSLDLSEHLRKVPGVQVKGRGVEASIKIRGNASIALNEEPLFILDDKPMLNYAQVYSTVNVLDIENIEVLKNASETGFYGSRGASGVILIKSKAY